MTTEELAEIGVKIGSIFNLIHETITEKQLLLMLDYCSQQETMGPMVNPTLWRDEDMFNKFDKAKERTNLLLKCLKI